MLKRILMALALLSASWISAEQPHLILGVNIGSSLTSIKPPLSDTKDTTLASINAAGGNASTHYPLLETSDTLKSQIVVTPILGMIFPITDRLILEGSANVDFKETSFTTQTEATETNKNLAKIKRDIGIGGAFMMRLSKQYAIGPVVEAHILTNQGVHAANNDKDYTLVEVGLQSTYRFHEYFTIGAAFTTALDQTFEDKDPSATLPKDLKLEYKKVKAVISFRLTPI